MGKRREALKKDNRGNPEAAPINGFRFILSYFSSNPAIILRS